MYLKYILFLICLFYSTSSHAIVVKKGTLICSRMSGYIHMMNLSKKGADKDTILETVDSCKENTSDVDPTSIECRGLLYCKGRLRGQIYWFNRQGL